MAKSLVELGKASCCGRPYIPTGRGRIGTAMGSVQDLLNVLIPSSLSLSENQGEALKSGLVFGGAGAVFFGIGMLPTRLAWGFRILGLAGMAFGIYKFVSGWSEPNPYGLTKEDLEDIEHDGCALAEKYAPWIDWVITNNVPFLDAKSFYELGLLVGSGADCLRSSPLKEIVQKGKIINDGYEWNETEQVYVQKGFLGPSGTWN
jgi:hypothetical protein